jgi:uncharacterized RDD family membrane protein YckC
MEGLMPFCAKCGTQYELSQEICSACNNLLLSVPQSTNSSVNQIQDDIRASRSLRIVAGIIDFAIALILAVLLLNPRLRMFKMLILTRIISVLAPTLYLLLKDCIDGKSIGKLFTGLTVFNIREKKPAGISDSILRNSFLVVPLIGPTLAFFKILFNNKRWGDGFSNTIVIKDSRLEEL